MSANPDLLPVDEALARVLALASPLGVEAVPIADLWGRALGENVVAQRTLPPWNNSAMDGYAVCSADLAKVPVRLRIVETIYAGQMPRRNVGPGTCARIMTGAPIPEGAAAVVMQEHTRRSGDDVEILESVPPRKNIRASGEDARAGELLLPAGTPLGTPELALLWAQGLTAAPAPRRPKVAILSSGDELSPLGDARTDRIIDTNGPSLALAVRRAGGEPTELGIAPDTLEDVARGLARADRCDVVLTSAGVSVGEHDYVREALEQLGVEMAFWRVAMRPGKPLAVGKLGRQLFFGLPGNPTSSLVSFELFVRPALRRMLGHADAGPRHVPATADLSLDKAAGLTHFVRVTATWREGRLWARPLSSQTSGALRSAAGATHLMVLAPETTRVAPGDPVDLIPVSWVDA